MQLKDKIGELDTVLRTLQDVSMNKQQQHQVQKHRSVIPYDDFLTAIQSHSTWTSDHSITMNKKKKRSMNDGRVIKRLKNKLRLSNVLIQKTDKSKVFHLGKMQDYRMKSEASMKKRLLICV